MAELSSNLPKEILVEIMTLLPPELLIRLKCLSKTWYVFINALIKDPTFAAKHLRNRMSSTYIVLRSVGTTPPCKPELKLLNVSSDDNVDDPIDFVSKDLFSVLIPEEYVGIGLNRIYHCNGIFCLYDCVMAYDTITLFNPAIKESKRLPKSNFAGALGMSSLAVGFGYDSRANDYKFVKFGFDYS
ncbi:F-box/kelch-repeat protein [Morus notabilis]|uniref:F-box/kelch-repeat protein n=1 Tax=Morus notabilis TaxID=981085 RepID=W9S742_9ROSA|nr:F-box/kelch-repeat protein [Morus notabilis]